jgi:hypothetical protein
MDQTFESLVEIMHHMHQQFPQAPRRAILLLADGQPSYDNAYGLSDAIAVANQYNIAICTIGVGPASELTWWPNSLYVHNMRQLAEQTGCVYSPASEIAALEPIFASLGEAFVEGQLVADLNIAPIPTSGETVTGAIHVTDALGVTQSAAFTFVAP